jgi:hypothetical protein
LWFFNKAVDESAAIGKLKARRFAVVSFPAGLDLTGFV